MNVSLVCVTEENHLNQNWRSCTSTQVLKQKGSTPFESPLFLSNLQHISLGYYTQINNQAVYQQFCACTHYLQILKWSPVAMSAKKKEKEKSKLISWLFLLLKNSCLHTYFHLISLYSNLKNSSYDNDPFLSPLNLCDRGCKIFLFWALSTILYNSMMCTAWICAIITASSI